MTSLRRTVTHGNEEKPNRSGKWFDWTSNYTKSNEILTWLREFTSRRVFRPRHEEKRNWSTIQLPTTRDPMKTATFVSSIYDECFPDSRHQQRKTKAFERWRNCCTKSNEIYSVYSLDIYDSNFLQVAPTRSDRDNEKQCWSNLQLNRILVATLYECLSCSLWRTE